MSQQKTLITWLFSRSTKRVYTQTHSLTHSSPTHLTRVSVSFALVHHSIGASIAQCGVCTGHSCIYTIVVLARKKSRLQRPSSFNSRYWQSNRRLDQWRLLYLLRLLSSQALQMDLNFPLLEAKRTGGWFSWRENRRRRWIVANSITDPFQLFLRAEYRSSACVSSFLFICTFHSAHQINSARSFFSPADWWRHCSILLWM